MGWFRVLRIPASAAGQIYTLTVFNDANSASTSVPNDGGLLGLGGSSSSAAHSLNVTSVMTSIGAEAFAIYLPPVNFSRGSQDNSLTTRSVTLQTTETTCGTTTSTPASTPVTVARPPVVLVHGLWGDPGAFDNFGPLYGTGVTNSIFDVQPVAYDNPITDITSTTPSYEVCTRDGCAFPVIKGNSLGFAYNAPSVLAQINMIIANYRTSAHVASVKADVVAHSMGGDISRTMLLFNSGGINLFLNNPVYPTFGAGPINKLITIATPHLGTPIAGDLLASDNACVRIALALPAVGDIALQSVTFSGETADGAVYDLEGNGFGGALSPALTALEPTQPFRTAYIAGVATSANFDGLDCSISEEGFKCVAGLLRLLCGNSRSDDPLAKDLTPDGWPTIFGQDNDAIVPLVSALNKTTSKLLYPRTIHSAALETLNFNGPSVLDSQSGIPNEVIVLLNEFPTGSDFF
jgi:pimeloyl-ACP methyl ester carboxylesterase